MPKVAPHSPSIQPKEPQNNLSLQLKWADKCTAEDIEKITQLGAENRRYFESVASDLLEKVTLKPPIRIQRKEIATSDENSYDRPERVSANIAVVDLTSSGHDREVNHPADIDMEESIWQLFEEPIVIDDYPRNNQIPMEVDAPPTVEMESIAVNDDDSVFTSVDVDALVKEHCQKQVSATKKTLKENVHFSLKSAEPTQDQKRAKEPQALVSSASCELRAQIDRVRNSLRSVREECDDASLFGQVPAELLRKRSELEENLTSLGRRLRDIVTPKTSKVDLETHATNISIACIGNDTPRCSCGASTTIATVQHGVNAKRAYYRCPTCGFHKWESDDPVLQFDSVPVATPAPLVSVNSDVNLKMQRAKTVLRDIFGHTSFRPNQEHVVLRAFEGRDVFVLMPTGGGKSLCYQLPACIDDGVTIVISPLISLIQDQVQQLEALEIAVAHLVGDQDYETVQKPIMSELFSNQDRIKLLYVTPEKIASSNLLGNLFKSLERRKRLARFVIDEAHCISQWGHDFRKDYMNLGQLRIQYPSVRIMALTATANGQTEADIIRNLKLKDPFTTRSSFNRPNLTYDVRRKSSGFLNEIVAFVKEHRDDSGIIYCLSKKDCEQLAEKLIKLLGYEFTPKASQISFYHAGLEPDDRNFRHHEWSKGKIKLIVATIAFGMGINKPDVRYVIHHTIPQSVTHYYQEAGRAGRDGYVANCILYYSFPDLTRRRKLITKDRENLQHQNVHFQNLRRMIEFCENQVECRRTSLLEYFGEHFDSKNCLKTCDNCKNRSSDKQMGKENVTEDCIAMLKMVKELQEDCESVTLVQASQIFLGLVPKNKEKKKSKYMNLACFGKGAGKYERSEVERILYHMILRQYLGETDKKNAMGFTTTFLACGYAARKLLQGEQVTMVFKTRRTSKMVAKSVDASSIPLEEKNTKKVKKPRIKAPPEIVETDEDVMQVSPKCASTPKTAERIPKAHVESLAQLLKDWRASVCDSFNVMPYHILPTSGIAAIANAVPTTSAELMDIDGVGRIRVKKYGEAIISIVNCYLQKHQLQPIGDLHRAEDKNSAPLSPHFGKYAANDENSTPFMDTTPRTGSKYQSNSKKRSADKVSCDF